MLEPLIVLTVLNCFFMFSSTVTTCALWWQYRTHRCCFKKDPMSQSTRWNPSKSKNNPSKNNNSPKNNNSSKNSNPSKKPVHSKQDNLVNSVSRSKSNSTMNRENKSRKNSKHKLKSKYLSRSKTPSDERLSSMEMIGNWELEDRARMSEASQTTNDPKSAVVMEYSTVQKIVQILDNDADLIATKMAMKDLNAKQNVEEKKVPISNLMESQFDHQSISEYTPQEQYN